MPAMRFAPVALFALVVGCGGSKSHDPAADGPPTTRDAPPAPDAPDVAPAFRNPVDLADGELALQALQILGADVPSAQAASCNSCHGLSNTGLHRWGALSATAMSTCLTDLAVTTQASAQQMVACMRTIPTDANSDFSTAKLGMYASAGRLPWFEYVFRKAYGPAAYQAELTAFQEAAAMPRGTVAPLTQGQFDIVAEWLARGQPDLDADITDGGGTTCTAGVSADVAAHVATQRTTGWRQVNADNLMAMYDCGAATDPRQCLQDKPLASSTAYGATWDVANAGHARILKDLTYRSYYWTRSSPDGRFVAHGIEDDPGSNIIDLQRDVIVNVANVQYDPGFFPDGKGWMFQGATTSPRNNICPLSALTSLTGTTATLDMTAAAGCSRVSSVGLYQNVGQALGGGDYFATDGDFTNDNGGHAATIGDPDATFDNRAFLDFTPMVFDGTKFVQKAGTHTATPYEGDWVMSPSAELAMSRVAGQGGKQLGYALYLVKQTPNGASYTTSLSKIARYCATGAKPAFSYDDRWAVFHHYVTDDDAVALGFASAADPGFAAYRTKGASNLYLLELATGTVTRLTNVKPGQYALYPHFRSDGWIYAMVREETAGHEYVVAHDGALVLEQ